MGTLTVRETLLRVLGLIEGGWIKGRDKKMRYGRPCYCLSGALNATSVDRVTRRDAVRLIERAVSPFNPGSVIIVDWNDSPGRTKPQVIAVLKSAIKLAEAA